MAILEAKLARSRDPKWLETHSVLGLDFGSDAVPRMPRHFPKGNDGEPVTAEAIKEALYYQLMERRQFVDPPDPHVADLFFDWGNIVALTGFLEKAVDLYEQSLRFGVVREPLVNERLAHMKRVIRRSGGRAGR